MQNPSSSSPSESPASSPETPPEIPASRESAAGNLRARAEQYLSRLRNRRPGPVFEDLSELIEELTIHQVELEMQGRELQESTEQLRIANEKYQKYFRHAPIPILLTDNRGDVLEYNLRAKDLLIPPNLPTSKSPVRFSLLLDSENRNAWLQFHEVLRTKTEANETTICFKSPIRNTTHYCVITGQKTGENENIIYFEDVTELRKTAAEFERLSLIAKFSKSFVIITDSNKKITWVNEAFEQFTGYKLAEVAGKNPCFLQGPGTDPATVKRMSDALAADRGFIEEVLNYTKSGQPYWIRLEVTPIRDAKGRVTGYFGLSSDITQIRQREEELLTFRSAIEQSPSTVVITDTEAKIQFVNPAFERITGYTLQEAIGQNPRILKSGDQGPEFYAKLWKTLIEGKQWQGIFHNRRKDGSLYWEFATIAPVRDRNGQVIKYIAVKQDITEQIEYKESLERLTTELRRTQEHLDQTNALALVGSWDVDMETGKITHSKITRRIHEIPDDKELTLDEAIDFYVGESKTLIRESVEHLIADGTPFDVEAQFRTARGNLRWVRAVGLADFKDGKCTRIYGSFQDITSQKSLQAQLEASLEEERRQLRFIQDLTHSLPVGVLQKDRHCHVIEANPAAQRITGFSRDELMRLTPQERYAEEDIPHAEEEDAALLAGKKQFVQAERCLRCKNGGFVPVLMTKAPIHDASDNIVGLLVAFMDISEIKRMEEELRKASREADAANRAKSAFLATMSHEIRTPLNAVIGMASLLAESELTNEQRDYAHTIVTASETLLDLISDILDYSKIESQKLTLETRAFIFEDMFLEPLELFNRAAAEKGIEITHWIDPQIPANLVGDRARIKQILINLLGNAVKFTLQGQISITAKLEQKDDRFCTLAFEVKDTGIGIPKEAQKQLFQPFSQADSSITRQFGGSGLGLAISRQLINLMGGEISVESTVGKGSTFRFTIRLENPTDEFISRQTAAELRGKRLLVVDDVPVNRKLVSSYAQKWGIEVREADGAIQTRDILKSDSAFDCIIFDYAMPFVDGATLAQEVAANPKTARIPRVLLSSIGDLTHDLPEHLFDRVLTKPIRPSRLMEILSELLTAKPVPPPQQSKETFPDLNVLIAEDNPNNRTVLRLMLKKCGVEPTISEDGKQALRAAETKDFDVIILDVQMPVMDGITAVQHLRERYKNQGRRPYFVALTANAFKEDEIRCLEAGFDRYCSKPVTIDQLRDVLATGAALSRGS